MTAPLKPIAPPVVGPLRTDKDTKVAIEELQRQIRELTVQVNELVSRLRDGKAV